jgi:outer membrane immunogenic protein
MRNRLVALLAAAASLGAAPAAFAADLPVKAPPPAEVVAVSWSGVYVGGHAGYAWGRNRWTFPFGEFYNTAPGENFSTRPRGFVGGVHVGYNHQMGNWVVGVEGSYDPTRISQTLVGPVTPAFPADSFKTSVRDLATATVRLGYANGPWLGYVKGGWASANLKLDVVSGPPGAGVVASVDKRRHGGTVGVGAEYMVMSHLILGVEYDYVRLQSASFNSVTSVGGPFNINSSHIDMHMVMGRASVKY